MALEIQKAVLDLIVKVTGGTMSNGTPPWLLRPGKAECRERWPLVQEIYGELAGQELPEVMPARDRRAVDGLLQLGGTTGA